MAEWGTSNIPYGKIHQLEVCQLLSSGSQAGLPRKTQWVPSASDKTLPESLSNGVTMLEGKSAFLQVDLSQSTTKEQEPKALSLGVGLNSTPAEALPGPSPQSRRPNQ